MRPESEANTPLTNRWFTFARVVFVALALLMLCVGVASYALFAHDVGQICTASAAECQSGLQFTTAEAADFQRQGISLEWMVGIRFAVLASAAAVCRLSSAVVSTRRSEP